MGEDCCEGKEGKDDCCKEGGCEMSHHMMKLADHAWAELAKEKMKKLWQEQRGANMDKIAEASVKGSMSFWMKKMNGEEFSKEDWDNFSKSLQEAMK